MPSETADTKKDDHYGADSIVVFEGLEGSAKRPAMYIGSTGKRGWHHLAYEIIDNGIVEALAGYCTHTLKLRWRRMNLCGFGITEEDSLSHHTQ